MKLFDVGIAFNPDTQTYGALLYCEADRQYATLENNALSALMFELGEVVLAKTAASEPEPNKIITLEESRPSLVAATGGLLNGS